MTKFKTISVDNKRLSLPPNLANYNQLYQNYNLKKELAGEIEFFENGHLNAAYNAVERHASTKNSAKLS